MLTLLFACAEPEKPDTAAPDTPTGGFALSADDHLALPFVTAGDAPPSGEITLTAVGERGSDGGVTVTVDGDFAVDGDTAALGPAESRRYMVRYTGDTSAPVIALGTATFTVDGNTVDVGIAAVFGDPALPPADWIPNGWGEQATVGLPSAPFPYPGAAYEDDSVLVFVPEGFTDRDAVGVVTHLHGWNATLSEVATAQRLVEQLAISGRDAVLVVPQGPLEASDGDFGRLMEPMGHATLVRDVLSMLYRDGFVSRPAVGEVALTAHSGGYLATAAILDGGGLPVTAVHLFDALYGEADTFAAFAEAGGVLRSSYTATGGTDADNAALRERLVGAGIGVSESFTDDALLASTVTIGPVDATHSGCVRDERAYGRWLTASGLPHRPTFPPELVSTVSDGYDTVVTWRADLGGDGLRYRVEGSDDGAHWSLLTDTGETSATVPATPYIRVTTTDIRYGNSEPSDTYGGTGADWLVVDAFDRALDGSWDHPTHTFSAEVGNALGARFSVASNDAVATGEVRLGDYPRVFWMLGDEGLNDRTFSEPERDAVEAFVDAGGVFVASGSEIGYATDPDWLADVLHAEHVADDAGTTLVEGWTVGAAYLEDSPDVLAGDDILWTWDTGGAAAVTWDDRVVVVGFGLENLAPADRADAFAALVERLD